MDTQSTQSHIPHSPICCTARQHSNTKHFLAFLLLPLLLFPPVYWLCGAGSEVGGSHSGPMLVTTALPLIARRGRRWTPRVQHCTTGWRPFQFHPTWLLQLIVTERLSIFGHHNSGIWQHTLLFPPKIKDILYVGSKYYTCDFHFTWRQFSIGNPQLHTSLKSKIKFL